MSTLPLEVHEVLEQEYVSMYGALETPPPYYDAEQVVDAAWAREIFTACGLKMPDDIVAGLNALLAKPDLKKLKTSLAITDNGRNLITHYSA